MDEEIVLQVECPCLELKKHLKVPCNMMVSEFEEYLRKSFGQFVTHQNLSTYRVLKVTDPEDKSCGSWLDPTKQLSQYYLNSDQPLMLLNTERVITVKVNQGYSKMFKINATKSVEQILKQIVDELGFPKYTEYDFHLDPKEFELDESNIGVFKSMTATSTVATLKKTMTISRRSNNESKLKSGTIRKSSDRASEYSKKKIEKIRKNLKGGDDRFLWLNRSETLPEQGVDENMVIQLKRRYFYDLEYIPKEEKALEILFHQVKEIILTENAMCSDETLFRLIAYHLQCEQGDMNEEFFSHQMFEDFLTPTLKKNFTKKDKTSIMEEWSNLMSISRYECQLNYIKICYKLPGFGHAIFICKRALPNEKKLVPCYLILDKEKVECYNAKNQKKEFSWPLEYIKLWKASHTAFHLTVEAVNYEFFTSQANFIQNTLSTYIQMIIDSRKQITNMGTTKLATVAIQEEVFIGKRKCINRFDDTGRTFKSKFGNLDARGRAGVHGLKGRLVDQKSDAGIFAAGRKGRSGKGVGMMSSKKIFMQNLSNLAQSLRAKKNVRESEELSKESQMYQMLLASRLRDDYAELIIRSKIVENQLAARSDCASNNSHLYSIVPEDPTRVDFNLLMSNLLMIDTSISHLIDSVKASACLSSNDDERDDIINSLASYNSCLQSILDSLDETASNPENFIGVLRSQNHVYSSEISKLLLAIQSLDPDVFNSDYQKFSDLIQAFKDLIMEIINNCKLITESIESEDIIEEITRYSAVFTHEATNCILLSKTHAATKSEISSYHQIKAAVEKTVEASQNVVLSTSKINKSSVEGYQKNLISFCDKLDEILKTLLGLFEQPRGDNRFIENIKKLHSDFQCECSQFEESTDAIVKLTHADNAGELADSIYDYLQYLESHSKPCAESLDELKNVLEDYSQALVSHSSLIANLSDSSSEMIIKDSNYVESLKNMEQAEQNLKVCMDKNIPKLLEEAQLVYKKYILSASISSIVNMSKSEQIVTEHIKSAATQKQLHDSVKDLNSKISVLCQALIMQDADCKYPPEVVKYELINAFEQFCAEASKVCADCQEAFPLVTDPSSGILLKKSHNELSNILEKALSLLNDEKRDKQDNLKLALGLYSRCVAESSSMVSSHKENLLYPLPNTNVESSTQILVASSKKIAYYITQFMSNIKKDSPETISNDLLQIVIPMEELVHSSRTIASCADKDDYNSMQELLDSLLTLTESGLDASTCASDLYNSKNLKCVSSDDRKAEISSKVETMSKALLTFVGKVPGQKDLEDLLKQMAELIKTFSLGVNESANYDEADYAALKMQFKASVDNVSKSVIMLVTSVSANDDDASLKDISDKLRKALLDLTETAKKIVSQLKDEERQQFIDEILSSLESVCSLVTISKATVQDNSNFNKQQLLNASRMFGDALTQALSSVVSLNPAIRSFNTAIEQLKADDNVYFDNPNFSVLNHDDYNDCVSQISDDLQRIKGELDELTKFRCDLLSCTVSQTNDHGAIEKVLTHIKVSQNCMEDVLVNISHSCYMLASSDLHSKPGRKGLLQHILLSKMRAEFVKTSALLNKSVKVNQAVFSERSSQVSSPLLSIISECVRAEKELSESDSGKSQSLLEVVKEYREQISKSMKEYLKAAESYSEESNEKSRKVMIDQQTDILETIDKLIEFSANSDIIALPCVPGENCLKVQAKIIDTKDELLNNIINMMTVMSKFLEELERNSSKQDGSIYVLPPEKENQMKILMSKFGENSRVLKKNMLEEAPGDKEIDAFFDLTMKNYNEVQQAILASYVDSLEISTERSKEFQEKIFSSLSSTLMMAPALKELQSRKSTLSDAVKFSQLDATRAKVSILSDVVIGFASILPVSGSGKVLDEKLQFSEARVNDQMSLLQQQLEILDSYMNLMNCHRKKPQMIVNGKNAIINDITSEIFTTQLERMYDLIKSISDKYGLVYYLQTTVDQAVTDLDKPETIMSKISSSDFSGCIVNDSAMDSKILKILREDLVTSKSLMETVQCIKKSSQNIINELESGDEKSLDSSPIEISENCVTLAYQIIKLFSQNSSSKSLPESQLLQTKTQAKSLFTTIKMLLDAIGNYKAKPDDTQYKRAIFDISNKFHDRINDCEDALQPLCGENKAIDQHISRVQDLNDEITSLMMFAQASLLERDTSQKVGAVEMEILKNQSMAKQFIEKLELDLKELSSSMSLTAVSANQTLNSSQMSSNVSSLISVMSSLCEYAKKTAVLMGSEDSTSQILVLTSILQLGKSLSDLINLLSRSPQASSEDQVKINPQSYSEFEKDLNVTVTDIHAACVGVNESFQSIADVSLKAKKAIESSYTRLVTALPTIKVPLDPSDPSAKLDKKSPDDSETSVTPEDVVRYASVVTLASSKIVSSLISGDKEEITDASGSASKAWFQLISSTRQLAFIEKSNSHMNLLLDSITNYLTRFSEMLALGSKSLSANSKIDENQLNAISLELNNAIPEIIKSASAVKGTDLVDPEGCDTEAERELLSAAAAIEAAAENLRKITQTSINFGDSSLSENVVKATLENAQGLMALTADLVGNAINLQKEIVQLRSGVSAEDRSWAQGLVLSSRAISNSISVLCEVIQACIANEATEARMTAAMRAVAASVAQLVAACNVKTYSNSNYQPKLVPLGKEVKSCTTRMMKQMKEEGFFATTSTTRVKVEKSKVGRLKQHMELKTKVETCEKELTDARQKLFRFRQKKSALRNKARQQKNLK